MPLASLRSGATQADCGIDHNLNIDDIQNTVIVQIVDRRFSAAIHIWKYPLAFRAMPPSVKHEMVGQLTGGAACLRLWAGAPSSIEPKSLRAWSIESSGVFPSVTLYLIPRTVENEFSGTKHAKIGVPPNRLGVVNVPRSRD
jgi:hypothetical protein